VKIQLLEIQFCMGQLRENFLLLGKQERDLQ